MVGGRSGDDIALARDLTGEAGDGAGDYMNVRGSSSWSGDGSEERTLVDLTEETDTWELAV